MEWQTVVWVAITHSELKNNANIAKDHSVMSTA